MPPPPPRMKISPDPGKRLKQAEQHLKKGRGFEAYVSLNDFPDAPEAERAAKLFPLARFMVDMSDGDGLTGLEDLDDKYLAAANALAHTKPDKALKNLDAALDFGETMDVDYTNEIISSLLELLGQNHPIVKSYQPRL